MKTTRILFSSVAIALLLLCAVSAWAKGAANVRNTVHNLSNTAPGTLSPYKSDESEICIFCHTPHGGLLEGPLWNHSMPDNTSFTHYNSATLSTDVGAVSRIVNDESLLCMACHDGSISTMHLINPSNTLGRNPWAQGFNENVPIPPQATVPGARIGGTLANPNDTGDLSDDHPISFSYKAVYDNNYAAGKPKDGQLWAPDDAVAGLYEGGEGVRFFGTDQRMECSSCHDPHVDYVADADYSPFLIRPNAGSGLCLTCHIK